MITLTQFETLPLHEQAAYTWHAGHYLMSRLTTDSIVNLFSVGDFYVEVTSDAHLHYVHQVSSFRTSSALDPVYLDTVSLHDLVTDRLPGIQQVREDAIFRMKLPLILLPLLIGAFTLIASPARAQADSASVAVEQKVSAAKWPPPGKVERSPAEPDREGAWLDGVEALQKVPEYTTREARRVKRDTSRADKLDRKAARQAQREARADEKPRRIKN